MKFWHWLLLGFFVVFVFRMFGRRRVASEGPELTSKDFSLADQALKEALACLGYSLNETADSPREAIDIGAAHLGSGERSLAPLAIAMGIAKRYAEANGLSEERAHAVKDHITSLYAELVRQPPLELSLELGHALQTEPTLGFLATKAHKDTWTIASQFRTTSVLRGMMFGRSP